MREGTKLPPRDYQTKMAEEINSLRILKRYLCNVATGGLQRPRDKQVEAACAACETQCGYGLRWLELYWAEEDRKWEAEHRDKAKEEMAIQIERLKREYEQMCRERKWYESGNQKPNTFLQTALKPRMRS